MAFSASVHFVIYASTAVLTVPISAALYPAAAHAAGILEIETDVTAPPDIFTVPLAPLPPPPEYDIPGADV